MTAVTTTASQSLLLVTKSMQGPEKQAHELRGRREEGEQKGERKAGRKGWHRLERLASHENEGRSGDEYKDSVFSTCSSLSLHPNQIVDAMTRHHANEWPVDEAGHRLLLTWDRLLCR